MSKGNLTDIEQTESQIVLEEYKRLYNEISKRLDLGDRNVNYQLVLFGIIITAVTHFWGQNQNVQYILLVSPFIFYALGSYYSINIMITLRISNYINNHIQPRLELILKSPSILKYDEFLLNKLHEEATQSNKLVLAIVIHWTLFMPASLLVAYLAIFFSQLPVLSFKILPMVLFIFNIVFFILTVKLNMKNSNEIKNRNNKKSIT